MFQIRIEELKKRSKMLSHRKITLPFKTLDPELKKFVAGSGSGINKYLVPDPQHWKNVHVVRVKGKQAKKKNKEQARLERSINHDVEVERNMAG